jgi:segregation and condensation protein B
MTDFDKEHDAALENSGTNDTHTSGEGSSETSGTSSTEAQTLGAAEAAPLVTDEAKPKQKGKKKGAKKKGLAAIEWTEETAKLDFTEAAPEASLEAQAAPQSDEDDEINALEALARRVAQTVSRNQVQALVESEPSVAEQIAEELSHTADALVDTEAELHAESMASALEAEVEAVSEEENAAAMIAAELAAETTAEELDAQSIAADAAFDQAMEEEFAGEAEPTAEEASAAAGEDRAEQMGFAGLDEEAEAVEAEAEADTEVAEGPTEFIEADQLVSIIESLLFSTEKPVSIATIKQIFKGSNIRTKDITRALDTLASDYARSTRGVTLEEINGGYQLRTKSDNTDFLRRLAKVRPFKLSGPALEVLSIVAYKQPVSKHEVDEIRGVESGHLVRALMERSLISFAGKSENLPGKPMTYGTTRKFLEIFGLRNLKELPTLSEIEEILPQGIGEEAEKETLSDLTDRLSTELTSSYSEGEDELLKINEQLAQVDTTSEFFEQEKQRERDRRDRERAQDIREKLVVGEAVEEKDKKWLDRYEAKLLAAEQAAQSGVPVTVSAEEASGNEPQIGGDLVNLTEEAQAAQAARAEDEDDEDMAGLDTALFADSDEGGEDLTGNMDWDEESESDKS